MSYAPVQSDLGSDLHLVSVRTLDEETKPAAGMVFHRQHLDSCFDDPRRVVDTSTGVVSIAQSRTYAILNILRQPFL